MERDTFRILPFVWLDVVVISQRFDIDRGENHEAGMSTLVLASY